MPRAVQKWAALFFWCAQYERDEKVKVLWGS